jgi:uncharacterized protein (TIGR02996 family)
MTEGTAFVRAICENPADDVGRLAYADWLDENAKDVCWRCDGTGMVSVEFSRIEPTHTDITCAVCSGSGEGEKSDGRRERAEFIRVQCRIAAMQKEFDPQSPLPADHSAHAEYKALRRRERELFGVCWKEFGWLFSRSAHPDFSEIMVYDLEHSGQRLHVRRGFVESVALAAAAFLGHAAELFRAQPVTAVRLSDREPYNNAANCWLWTREGSGAFAPIFGAALRGELFDRLDFDIDIRNRKSWRTYRTRDAALAALSAAAVAHGRALARLSPLDAPAPAGGGVR